MGSASTKNVAESTMDALTSVATNIINKTDIKFGQSQIISVVGGTGNVKINGNTQIVKVEVKMENLLKAMATTTAQTDLTNKLDQVAKSLLSGINLAQFANAVNITKNYMKVVTEISTNIQQSCSAEALQTQVISVAQRNGQIDITNNRQEAVASLFIKCIQDAIVNNSAVTAMQNIVSQSAAAEAKGISEWALVLLALFALLAITLPIVLPIAIGVSSIMKNLITIFAILIVIAGIVFIVLYYTSQTTSMQVTPFSKTIDRFLGDCNAIVLPQSAVFDTPFAAGNACLANEQCQAFDWSKAPKNPLTTNDVCVPTTIKKKLFLAGCEEKKCDNPDQKKIKLITRNSQTEATDLARPDYRFGIDECGFGMTCNSEGSFKVGADCRGFGVNYYVTICEDKELKTCPIDPIDPNDPPINPVSKTIFYSQATNPCDALQSQLDQSPRFIQKRVWLQGQGSPVDTVKTNVEGAVYVDVTGGRYYVYSIADGWVVRGDLGFENLSSSNKLIITDTPPKSSEGKDAEIAIDKANPQLLQIYRRRGNNWIADSKTVIGPSYLYSEVPEAVSTSGFKYVSKNTWQLWVGITCLIVGVLMLILFFTLGLKKAKTTTPKK